MNLETGVARLSKKELGAFYTPEPLSAWVSKLLIKSSKKKPLAVLDPSCGDGALLKCFSHEASCVAYGVDVVRSELNNLNESWSHKNNLNTLHLDTLNPSNGTQPSKFWKHFFKTNKVTHVISNPPWGAELLSPASFYQAAGFTLARGQYDSYGLFIELMLEAGSKGSMFAFIIPDSIFQPEHSSLRALILNNTIVHHIIRLGEGFFNGVFRGAAVLILEKGMFDENHVTNCLRISKAERELIFSGKSTFEEIEKSLKHGIKQSRFLNNLNFTFDIDVKNDDATVAKIERIEKLNLADYFSTGRGVEISKSGEVVICPACKAASSVPKQPSTISCQCGNNFEVTFETLSNVVSATPKRGTKRLLVGEDIQRYSSKPSRYLVMNIAGVNYKENFNFSEPKILVRKTGVGITSTIDYSGAHTNQVVFHYQKLKSKVVPEFALEYLQGVLSSRLLCAYYLQKFGDTEWRSHAYITQKIISQLPIPAIHRNSKNYAVAKKIANLVRKKIDTEEQSGGPLDLKIEQLVMSLFDFNKKDIQWIKTTLEQTQQMKSIKNLLTPESKMKDFFNL